MDITVERSTFVIIGKLASMTKSEAWSRIEKLGGHISKTPRPSSTYIVVGAKPTDAKLARAKAVKKPLLTEAQFIKALEAATEAVAEARGQVKLSDAVSELRGLVYDVPSRETWAQITDLLDRCSPAELEMAVDYVEQHIKGWVTPAQTAPKPLPFRFVFQSGGELPPMDYRVPPPGWLPAILQGETSPRFRLLRSLMITGHKVNATMSSRVTTNPDLLNLEDLDVGYGDMTVTFYRKLRKTEHLPSLTSLTMRSMNHKMAAAMCGEHNLHGLRHIKLGHCGLHGNASVFEALYDQLFEASWWSQIEGLLLSVTRQIGSRAVHFSANASLARNLSRLPRLKHLVVGDVLWFERVLEAGALRQLERVSLYTCETGASLTLARGLRDEPEHTVKVIDLSTATFYMSSRIRPKEARVRISAHVNNLLKLEAVGALEELVTVGGLLDAETEARLQSWADERGVRLTPGYTYKPE